MALTAAEKQRRYRQKRDNDPVRRSEYLTKSKLKYARDKQDGKRLLVADMSDRAKRAERKRWRHQKRTLRQKKKQMASLMTPPCSPINDPNVQPGPSRQFTQARRQAKRFNAKCQRENKLLKLKLKQAKKMTDMYRKRWERQVGKHKDTAKDTPRSKTKRLLRHFHQPSVKKTLLFHNALKDQIKGNLKGSKKNTMKAVYYDLYAGNIIRKYKLKKYAEQEFGIYTKQSKTPKRGTLSKRLKEKVESFFERDDVSRLVPGQKSTVTLIKVKKQKRFLLDSLEHLHMKYLSENTLLERLSYTTFTRLRPFWVLSPRNSDRETCLCKTCENVKLLAEALEQKMVLTTSNIDSLVRETVCSIDHKTCMYGECNVCKEKPISMEIKDNTVEVSWMQWTYVREERNIKGKGTKEVTYTKKTENTGSLGDLCDIFHDQMWTLYRRHRFNISNQFKYYRKIKSELTEAECFIHVDFAENYVGKYGKEVTGMHFGASKPQISLHTGYYVVGGSMDSVSFCGVSDSLIHGPAAVWAYLNVILTEIKTKFPAVNFVHFFSDGPSTQYRQKGNFFLLATEIYHLGFTGASWNFHESGHGKGIPDAIGGSVKRSADELVKQGKDILDANSFVEGVTGVGTRIQIYKVDAETIERLEKHIQRQTLQTVQGTLKIHQVVTVNPTEIKVRDVSCTCLLTPCETHHFRDASFSAHNFTSKSTADVEPNKKMNDKSEASAMKTDTTKNNQNTMEAPGKGRSRLENDKMKHNRILSKLQKCKTFQELKTECANINMPEIIGRAQNIEELGLSVDQTSLLIYPNDVPEGTIRSPVHVRADGDCLPGTGSVFAFGTDASPYEMRLRIVIELALHEEFYLDGRNLKKGYDKAEDVDFAKTYAFYSDMLMAGRLTPENIKLVFEKEVMKITVPQSYMGIWQFFGLSSVLKMPVFSVYPNLGNPFVRSHLNRLIYPREQHTNDIAFIMWTTTRHHDMVAEHWEPNHFEPVLLNQSADNQEFIVITGEDPKMDEVIEEREPSVETNPNMADNVDKQEFDVTTSKDQHTDDGCMADNKETYVKTNPNMADNVDKQEFDVTKSKDQHTDDGCMADNKETYVKTNPNMADNVDKQEFDVTKSKDQHTDDGCMADNKETYVKTNPNMADIVDKQEFDVTKSKDQHTDDGCMADNKETYVKTNPNMADIVDKQEFDVTKSKDQHTDDGCMADNKQTYVKTNPNMADIVDKQEFDVTTSKDQHTDDGCMADNKETYVKTNADPKIDDVTGNQEPYVNTNKIPKMDGVNDNHEHCLTSVKDHFEIPDTESCLWKFVIVLYDGIPYPGYVEDLNKDDIFVECMHRVNRKKDNCFFWPKRIKDKCWYPHDKIIAVIPEPSKISGSNSHYEVDPVLWESAKERIKELNISV